ncbi:MAG: glycosyltransferase family 2 protein [Candidatus Magasanikbacteria bacterium]|nr:glycosyltransferase family 2 protein [Candidatus Magasanikbacteria bacterium]
MQQPLISVIIPVYNHAHTLKKTLESIFNQTYRPLEVIVVNDGSTDNFDEVVKECLLLTDGDCIGAGSVLSVISQPNSGAPVARNKGFAMSKGEYVIFWDADTLAHPQMLQKMFAYLQKHPDASYAYSQFKFGWKTIKSRHFNADKLKQVNYIDITSLIRRSTLNCHPEQSEGSLSSNAVIPTAVEESLSRTSCPFDVHLKRFQDWDLWLTMLEQGKTGVFIPEVLYEKVVGSREGISTWLPSFMYQLPWKTKQVKKYEEAKQIIIKKHHLS